MSIFIKNYHSISSLNEDIDFKSQDGASSLHQVIEPDYEELLDVRSMRRLSKILKMGVFSSLRCLQTVDSDKLDGIITGTGLGCTADTLAFLENMITREEHLLTPTAFIQSTHNTLSGTLGIMLKNHGYNMTWSQRYFSFFKALEDGILRIEQGSGRQYLIVGADEMPDKVAAIIGQMDVCTTQSWTEGSAAFLISDIGEEHDLKIASYSIQKTESINNDLISKLSGPDTITVNVNPKLSELIESVDGINLGNYLGNIFVNDGISLAFACRELNKNGSKYNSIICLSGDETDSSIIVIEKQR